jgi:hypothetical protein
MPQHPAKWGTKLGPRVGSYVIEAITYTHARLVHLKHKLAMAVFHAISDEISEEVDVTLGPFLQKLHDQVPENHPAYPAIHLMHTASGQLKALAGTGLQISGLLGSISAVMNNELADAVYGLIGSNPHLLPDTSTLLQLAAANLITPDQAKSGIAAQGIDGGWADAMLTATYSYPSVADGLEMMRRGIINRDQFAAWAGLNGIPEAIAGMWLQLQDIPVSAADAALAVLRGNITQDQANQIAAANGVAADQFQILINNTGEPPGLMQLLEAYRRGFIDKPTLEQGIRDSRYRNEWIPMLEQLRYEPMSVADAVNATVQAQLDQATAEKYADQNGLQPGDFQILLNTAGEPLSRTEMEELFNRGLVTQAQVEQALRESRLKNKYNTLAFELHAKVLPIFTLQNALRHNGITQADAIKIAMESGYTEADATTIVNAGNAELLQPYRDKVVSAVQALYEDNIMDAATATSTIEGAGFTKDQADYIIKSSEFRREARTVNAGVSAIRTKYLSHHITSAEASGYLDKIGVSSTQRDYLLMMWEIETQAFTKELTEAQIVKAVNNSLITSADGQSRLEAMGYSTGDATLLLNGA